MTVLAISKGFFKTLSSRRSHCRSLPDFPRRFGFSRVRRSHLQALQAFRKGNRHSQIHHFASFHQRWGCAAKAHRLDVGATSLASFVNFRTRGRGPTRGLNDRIAARVRRKLSACSPHKNAATFAIESPREFDANCRLALRIRTPPRSGRSAPNYRRASNTPR